MIKSNHTFKSLEEYIEFFDTILNFYEDQRIYVSHSTFISSCGIVLSKFHLHETA